MAEPPRQNVPQAVLHDTQSTSFTSLPYTQPAYANDGTSVPPVLVEGTLPFWFFILVALAIVGLSFTVATLFTRIQRRREARKAALEAEVPPPYEDESLPPAYEDLVKDPHYPAKPTARVMDPPNTILATARPSTAEDHKPIMSSFSPRHDAA